MAQDFSFDLKRVKGLHGINIFWDRRVIRGKIKALDLNWSKRINFNLVNLAKRWNSIYGLRFLNRYLKRLLQFVFREEHIIQILFIDDIVVFFPKILVNLRKNIILSWS